MGYHSSGLNRMCVFDSEEVTDSLKTEIYYMTPVD